MLMPLRVQWLVQPSVYTQRPCHIRSTHIACVYRPELENKQTSQWLDHSPCRCASPSPFAAVRREIEHQSLARQHSLAHGAPAVLPQSFSLGRQFLPRRRPIADTPASLRPAPCPMLPAPRIPAGSERITGLPKGHDHPPVVKRAVISEKYFSITSGIVTINASSWRRFLLRGLALNDSQL